MSERDYTQSSEREQLKQIHARAVEATSDRSESGVDKTIGSIGEDLINRLYTHAGDGPRDIAERIDHEDFETVEDITLYYGKGGSYTDTNKTIPFYFELAAVPTQIREKHEGQPTVNGLWGINQSVLYNSPRIALDSTHSEGYSYPKTMFRDIGHDFAYVAHIYCPNVSWRDQGKQTFDHEPFKHVISEIIGKAYRKMRPGIRPRLNELRASEQTVEKEPLEGCAEKGDLRDFCFANMIDAHAEASNGGEITPRQRQLYYEMRRRIRHWAEEKGIKYKFDAERPNPEPFELEDSYFFSVLSEYENEEIGHRIATREQRGHFTEPHSNLKIPLGTVSVNRYNPSETDDYGDLLFVEKTGFHEQIHQQFELTKKYDIAPIEGKGWSTNAVRDLIEKIQRENPETTVYALTDLDVAGVGIADNLEVANALSDIATLSVERIGVTMEDVKEYGLEGETVSLKKGQRTQLQNLRGDGVIDDETYEFMTQGDGRRVEINEIPPSELGNYLEGKFEQRGVEKVHPETDDIQLPDYPDPADEWQSQTNNAVGNWLRDQLPEKDDLAKAVRQHAAVPTDSDFKERLLDEDIPFGEGEDEQRAAIHEKIVENLADKPPEHYSDMNDEMKEEYDEEAEAVRGTFEDDIGEAVADVLDEYAEVGISINYDIPKDEPDTD